MIPPGRWDLFPERSATHGRANGFVLPPGTHLRGAGSQLSIITRHASGGPLDHGPLLTVTSDNSVTNLTFTDENRHLSPSDAAPVIQLGTAISADRPADVGSDADVEDIVVSNNVFRRVGRAIVDSGRRLARVFVTGNDFAAYADALLLIGSRSNVA